MSVRVEDDTMKLGLLMEAAQAQDSAMRAYVQDAAGSSTASEIQKLADLRQQGVLSEEEFTAQKAKLLAE